MGDPIKIDNEFKPYVKQEFGYAYPEDPHEDNPWQKMQIKTAHITSDEEARIAEKKRLEEAIYAEERKLGGMKVVPSEIKADFAEIARYNPSPSSRLRRSPRFAAKTLKKETDMSKYNLLELRDPKTGEEIFAINNEFEVKVGDGLKEDNIVQAIAAGLTQFMTGSDADRVKYKAALIHCLAAMRMAEATGTLDRMQTATDEAMPLWEKAKDLAQQCFNVRE